MSEKFNENEWIQILLLYLIPILSWILYTHQSMPLKFSWLVAVSGCIILFFCSALLISLWKNQSIPMATPIIQETQIKPIADTSNSAEYKEKIEFMQNALTEREGEAESMKEQLKQVLEENSRIKAKLSEVLEASALKDEEAKHKIESLELEVNQKLQTSKQLENQIHDLRYEIKTLLQLTEVDYSQIGKEPALKENIPLEPVLETLKPSKSTLKNFLTRCLDIAQKITSGYHSSSLRGLSLDPYAFDLRRLSDALRQESQALVLVYSPKEERVLFANGETKNILGISPEQFAQDFSEFAGTEFITWKSAVTQLLTKSEVNMILEFKTKSNGPIALNTLMASIPTGVFRSWVIAVMQPF